MTEVLCSSLRGEQELEWDCCMVPGNTQPSEDTITPTQEGINNKVGDRGLLVWFKEKGSELNWFLRTQKINSPRDMFCVSPSIMLYASNLLKII